MALQGRVVEVAQITTAEIDRMYALMECYFADVQRAIFDADLAEKAWAILLHDTETGNLHGFSTLCLLEETVLGVPVRALFSGDTIIDRPFWGSLALERSWLRFLFDRIDAEPEYRWYWFLISKGYRTYRYLPVFFHQYHPSPAPVPEFEQAVLDGLARAKFGERYDPRTGIIRCRQDYRLRPGVSDISPRELRDPRIAYFQQRNPGWVHGEELACLAELSRTNLRRCGHRLLGEVGS